MGQTLGLEVVAEGVETLDELQFLQDMQCDQVQGYFLSRPVPCAEATALIQDFSVLKNLIVKNNNQIQHSNFRMSSALLSVINDSSDNNTPQSANSQLPRAS